MEAFFPGGLLSRCRPLNPPLPQSPRQKQQPPDYPKTVIALKRLIFAVKSISRIVNSPPWQDPRVSEALEQRISLVPLLCRLFSGVHYYSPGEPAELKRCYCVLRRNKSLGGLVIHGSTGMARKGKRTESTSHGPSRSGALPRSNFIARSREQVRKRNVT